MTDMIGKYKSDEGESPMRSGSKYLALALDVRKLTDSLIELVEGGTVSKDLYDSIREVVASIEGAGKKTPVKALRQRGKFGHYPSVLAMNEVVRPEKRQEVLERLQGVIDRRNRKRQRESALEAITFFDALERRALYHSSQNQGKRTAALSR
jgi:hypothetical protein